MKRYNDIFDMSRDSNILMAKRLLVDSIYQQANLEGIAVTYADTNNILNNINIPTLTPTEISKVFCLRDGWHYLLENLEKPLDLGYLEDLHSIIARFDVPYYYLGKPRTENVLISGTNWRPEIPNVDVIHKQLMEYQKIECITERALKTGLFLMKTQFFQDGNKRIGTFAINKILIQNGKGLFNVPVELDSEFKHLLVNYYETDDCDELLEFIIDNCMFGTNRVNESVIDEEIETDSSYQK